MALTPTPGPWGGQISEELNGGMDVPCGMWGETAGAEPALILAPKLLMELSRALTGEPEDGEAGKGHL